VSTVSAGFQAGVSVSENVTLIMTDKGLNTLLSPSMKVGGDASVAAGPIGASAASDVTGDFISFSRSKGLYGGLNLDGTVIAVSNDWNKTYYGKDVLPPDILIKGTVKSDKANAYVAAVRDAAK
jgi:lipid-binding SYLF domain-containing protein